MKAIRLFLVEDHHLLAAGLKRIIADRSDMMVVGVAESAEQALEMISGVSFDVLLLDITLPGKDGIWLLKEVKQLFPQIPVLMLTMHREPKVILEAVEAGASGYLVKTAAPEEFARAVLDVVQGKPYLDSAATQAVLARVKEPVVATTAKVDPRRELTARERAILALVAQGLRTHEIGKRLFLSESTVKSHLRAVFTKLKVADRLQAVMVAGREGLMESDKP